MRRNLVVVDVCVCQISYIIFLFIYIYTVLVRSLPMPEWNEWYVVMYMVGLALDKLREVNAMCFCLYDVNQPLTIISYK